MSKLSVVITAYNEEKNIEDCLKSAKDLADEIVVVDNSSTDKTVEIARKFTKKIYQQENDPTKIDIQKNFGFSKATGVWILSLDADERVTPELAKEIKSVISSKASVSGYEIPRRNIIFGKWIQSDMWWPDYQLKLFKKGKGKYENQVHRALKVDGETQKFENPLIHNNYKTVSQFVSKLNTYTDIEVERFVREDYKFHFLDAVRFPVDDFVKTFFLQKGFRDGLHGLVLSILQAFYMEVVFAKLWEKHKFEEINSPDFIKQVNQEWKVSFEKIKYWFITTVINQSKNPIKKILLKAARKRALLNIKKSS